MNVNEIYSTMPHLPDCAEWRGCEDLHRHVWSWTDLWQGGLNEEIWLCLDLFRCLSMKPSGIPVCQRCPQGVMHSVEVVNGVSDCCSSLLVQVMQEAKVAAATAKGGSLISSGAPCLCFHGFNASHAWSSWSWSWWWWWWCSSVPFEASSEPDHAGTGLCGHNRRSASAGNGATAWIPGSQNDLYFWRSNPSKQGPFSNQKKGPKFGFQVYGHYLTVTIGTIGPPKLDLSFG